MDTATHLVMGVTLGSLATLDPAIAQSDIGPQAVMLATIAGSNIPDIDTVLKLRNNAKYIRNHRGITHSIPAVILWSFLISGISFAFFSDAPYLHLLLWSFIAVFLHVFVDIFNAYGTQALRPFTKKWVALGIINTFDTVIFFIHLLAIACMLVGSHKGYTALSAYILMIVYYIGRIMMHRNIRSVVYKRFNNVEKIIISPSYRFYHYHLAIVTTDYYYVARWIVVTSWYMISSTGYRSQTMLLCALRNKMKISQHFYHSPLCIAGTFSIMIIIMKFDSLICDIAVKIIIHSLQSFNSIII